MRWLATRSYRNRYANSGIEAEAATPSVGEPEALARKQRLVLDKACRCLGDQGFGTLELASKRAS